MAESAMAEPTMAGSTLAGSTRGSLGVAILRVTLGVIILVTWWGNIGDDFYTADGLRGFFDWLFKSGEEGGNGSTLTVVDSFVGATILKAPGLFGFLQTIMEGLIGLGLLIGGFTRLFSALSFLFFTGLFLSYFGGEEWIWTYVILMAASATVFLSWGGRKFGIDQQLASARGESPATLLW